MLTFKTSDFAIALAGSLSASAIVLASAIAAGAVTEAYAFTPNCSVNEDGEEVCVPSGTSGGGTRVQAHRGSGRTGDTPGDIPAAVAIFEPQCDQTCGPVNHDGAGSH